MIFRQNNRSSIPIAPAQNLTMPHLFFYGTIQLPWVQLSSFNRLLTGTADTLPNYTLGSLEITDPQVLDISNKQHPIAIPSAEDCITGIVFELTEQELQVYLYEVDYNRAEVTLTFEIQTWICFPMPQ